MICVHCKDRIDDMYREVQAVAGGRRNYIRRAHVHDQCHTSYVSKLLTGNNHFGTVKVSELKRADTQVEDPFE